MSDARPHHYTVERETDKQTGETRERFVPYVPPLDPPRPFIIEALDGTAILLTPGQRTTYVRDRDGIMVRSDAPAARKVGTSSAPVVYEGYRPLHDRLHATRMTEAEAVAFAKAKCWVLADNCPPGGSATHQLIAI